MDIADNVAHILQAIDPNPSREELAATPERVATSLKFLTQGYHINTSDILHNALFATNTQEMIVIQDITFHSLCEHHLLPFFGTCHIAYIPNKHILGVSKFAEIVDIFAKRLQIQERLSDEIATCLFTHLQPKGLGIIMQARHLCMEMRSLNNNSPRLVTQKMLGQLAQPQQQQLFFNLIQHSHQRNDKCSGRD